MSQMLPEGGEVMRRAACGDVCPAPPPAPSPSQPPQTTTRSENKELLRQQLLSASKERLAEKTEPPKQKHSRNRQKNRWKLKFHHQALPQEYLDHYERSLQKANAKQKQKTEKPKPEPDADSANVTSETFKIWAQRLAALSGDNTPAPAPATPTPDRSPPPRPEDRKKKNPAIAPTKIVTFEDLPYMGEMTLNDSKPRRGRKPKKADICHLIYENYGTVVPGRPPPAPAPPPPPAAAPAPRTDLQNRIISSLLERKLSAERGRRAPSPPRRAPAPAAAPGALHSDEPLNLCIRDLRDLKLQIQRKFGDIYAALPDLKREPTSPPTPPAPPTPDQANAISVIQRNTSVPPAPAPAPPPAPACWGAGVLLPPLLHTQLLYYQRLGALPAPPEDPPSSPASASPASLSPEDPGTKLVLKRISELLDPDLVKREETRASPERAPKRTSPRPPAAGGRGPAKRKRSAIFIPPLGPRSSSSTPTAEVSICKFKFTGGSKPSLQEKKMLSVDAGGNFRYYNGTSGKGAKAGAAPPRGRPDAGEAAPQPPAAPTPEDDSTRRKRKSRKSLQREKLEQTFKEKGFLIQTQQLQSAEGATYCKFRQLRKFTRYLFRSWKDYLPGELEQGPPAPAPAGAPSPPRSDPAPDHAEWG